MLPAIGHTAEREDLVVHVVQYGVSRMMITGYAAITPLRRFLHVRLVVLLDGALPSVAESHQSKYYENTPYHRHEHTN